MLKKRYQNTGKERIHTRLLKVAIYKALMYYGQQEKIDTIIKADKLPDGSDGHLSNMKHNKGTTRQVYAPGQPQEKKGEPIRACTYSEVSPAPHRFSQCSMKASNQAKKAEERVKNDVQVARMSITSRKVEEIPDSDESLNNWWT
ncbi:hypothetical protein SARC_07382 [Sphaeroforma arctica JP610]|uniref:Uncharacterized protein n=1 Tax=Sphaeroforma arctica JP610 TaxID=667725 RepID=A0A0L0FUB8_9EUKA|nr:hypothetical protein SARC_07382 [Sphaeroforma arctica JP610]KNC80259.1 hypothetical protein SARC_07382 [Sphaeroforma arctica JP610]|eukprot:XP_014154161.1 hypothetical protein SARC_07382 [Sphaeroforma arctica JP610]